MRRLLWPLGLAAALFSPLSVQAQPETSSTLATASALAQAHSLSVSAARREVEASEGELRQAGVLPNPELAVLVEDERRATRTTTAPLNIPLELGGKRAARVAEAQRANELARAALLRRAGRAACPAGRGLLSRAGRAGAGAARGRLGRARAARRRRHRAPRGSRKDFARRRNARPGRTGQRRARDWPTRKPNCRSRARRWLPSGAARSSRYAQVRGELDTLPARADVQQLMAELDSAPALMASRLELERRKARSTSSAARQYPDVTLSVGAKRDNEQRRHAGRGRPLVPLPLFDRNQGRLRGRLSRADKAEDDYRQRAIRLVGELQQAASQLAAGAQRVAQHAAGHRAARRTAGLRRRDERLRGRQVRLPRRARRPAHAAAGARRAI